MDNKAMIVTSRDINYSGEVLGNDFIENGVMLKPSAKSDVKVWIGVKEIENIIFPDGSRLEKQEVTCLFKRLAEIKEKYSEKTD